MRLCKIGEKERVCDGENNNWLLSGEIHFHAALRQDNIQFEHMLAHTGAMRAKHQLYVLFILRGLNNIFET